MGSCFYRIHLNPHTLCFIQGLLHAKDQETTPSGLNNKGNRMTPETSKTSHKVDLGRHRIR